MLQFFYSSAKSKKIDYVFLAGGVAALKDLDKHKFITYGRGAPSPVYNPDWVLKHGNKDGKKRKSIMRVNSVYGLLLAVQSGVGLAAIPDYIAHNVNNITKVLKLIKTLESVTSAVASLIRILPIIILLRLWQFKGLYFPEIREGHHPTTSLRTMKGGH